MSRSGKYMPESGLDQPLAEELTDNDQRHLRFGDAFEERFIGQARDERRTIERTLEIAWELLSMLPRDALHRVTPEQLEQYYGKQSGTDQKPPAGN